MVMMVLPLPEGPTMAVGICSGMVKVTFFNTCRKS